MAWASSRQPRASVAEDAGSVNDVLCQRDAIPAAHRVAHRLGFRPLHALGDARHHWRRGSLRSRASSVRASKHAWRPRPVVSKRSWSSLSWGEGDGVYQEFRGPRVTRKTIVSPDGLSLTVTRDAAVRVMGSTFKEDDYVANSDARPTHRRRYLEGSARGRQTGERVLPTQTAAIERGAQMAQRVPGNSQLVIHGEDGRVRDERAYGEDPSPPRG